MTSKDTNDDGPEPQAAIAYAERKQDHERILAGHLPDIDKLLAGADFFRGDIREDVVVWCDSWLFSIELDKWQKVLSTVEAGLALRPLIQNLRDTGSVGAMRAVERAFRKLDHADADRMLCYLACSKGHEGRAKLVESSRRGSGWEHDEYDRLHTTATAIGLTYGFRQSMSKYCELGLSIIKSDGKALEKYEAARDAAAADAGKADIERLKLATAAVAKADAEPDYEDVLEDRAEIVQQPPSLVVVPTKPDATGARKDTIKSWGDKIEKPLPLVTRGDIAQHRRSLVERWPHAAELIDIVLGDLAAREEVRFRPTLFVGAPGSGKSSLARAILETVGLPCELQSLAGVHDASLMGTSAQWSSARESTPLQLIKRSAMASVGMIWDEVEKIGTRTENGNALDALLPMLEPDQARRYRDLALEVEVDLSMVSHFATANSLEGIPAPLRDRMRILVMPTPGWQHLGTMTRQIVGRIAKDRGVDGRWYAPLAEDEMDLVRKAWPGGSIRQLTRIVTTILDGRETIMARC